MLFDLDEIKTDADANECAEQLIVEAIKASEDGEDPLMLGKDQDVGEIMHHSWLG